MEREKRKEERDYFGDNNPQQEYSPSSFHFPLSSLFNILREVGQLHVTLASQRVVHSEGSGQVVTGLAHLGNLQVVPQQLLVVGVCTVLYDTLSTLCRRLATQVGNTLLGNDDVDVVLRAVLVMMS